MLNRSQHSWKLAMDVVVSIAKKNKEMMNRSLPHENVTVIFVLGGPGSGKSTQCPKIAELYRFTHLSAGELLRTEAGSGSEDSTKIQNIMNEGKLVPSELTVKLLQQAMQKSGNDKFLIDGFPRDKENLAKWDYDMSIEPKCVLNFRCSEEVMFSRLLKRNQGREDDKLDTIRKRFKVLVKDDPLIESFRSKGILRNINAERSPEEVFEEIKGILSPLVKSAWMLEQCQKQKDDM